MTVAKSLVEPDAVEFTFDWYTSLLEYFKDHGYSSITFDEEVRHGDILLRHDVDLSPRKAVVMARIEAELGFTSTYFFLVTSPLYNVLDGPNRQIFERLIDLGHQVGLHFNSHQYWRSEPKLEALHQRIEENRSALTIATPEIASAVSFHCPPEWALDRDLPGIKSTYAPGYFSEIAYSADSGQRWRDQGVVDEVLPDRLQMLTHPGLWGADDQHYIPRVTRELNTTLDRTERYVSRELLHDRFDVIEYPSSDIGQWMPSGRLPSLSSSQP